MARHSDIQSETEREQTIDLEHAFGQIAIVLLGDLGAICGTLEHGWIVVDILDMDDDGRVVLLQVVRGG